MNFFKNQEVNKHKFYDEILTLVRDHFGLEEDTSESEIHAFLLKVPTHSEIMGSANFKNELKEAVKMDIEAIGTKVSKSLDQNIPSVIPVRDDTPKTYKPDKKNKEEHPWMNDSVNRKAQSLGFNYFKGIHGNEKPWLQDPINQRALQLHSKEAKQPLGDVKNKPWLRAKINQLALRMKLS